MNYYNENEPYAAQWLRNLIAAGLIPEGDVDDRSITDVRPDDLDGYTQCHFFAGIAGWSLALQLAGWPADSPVWTGSCPCQPFAVGGKQKGFTDKRDLWPIWFELIKKRKPSFVFGEQVAASIKHGWLDRMLIDLEGESYACGATIIPACAVDAPHKRERLWFVADMSGRRREQRQQTAAASRHGSFAATESSAIMANTACDDERRYRESKAGRQSQVETGGLCDSGTLANGSFQLSHGCGQSRQTRWDELANSGFWANAEWLQCADGKSRRVKSGVRLLAHGVPNRVGRLRSYGNAIVPQAAAEFIKAYMEVMS